MARLDSAVTFARPFAAIRKDPHWVRKVLIGALVSLIPYVGMVVLIGWYLDYMRRVAWGDDEHLPEWGSYEDHIARGFYAVVGMLPLSMVLSVVVLPLSVGMLAPILFVPAFGEDGLWLALGVAALMYAGMFAAMLLAGWAIVPLTESIAAQVALYGQLGAAFQYRDMWRRLKSAWPEVRRAWWYTVVLGMAASVPMLIVITLPFAPLLMLVRGSVSAEALLVWFLVATALSAILFVAYMAVSIMIGLANHHYWGRWARVAYELDQERTPGRKSAAAASEATASPPDTPAAAPRGDQPGAGD